jgi:hypothetical protein
MAIAIGETILSFLQIILVILIILLVIKLFFSSNVYNDLLNNLIGIKKQINDDYIDNFESLEAARLEAFQNINRAIEESFVASGSGNGNGTTGGDDSKLDGYITNYLNRANKIKLELYYKPTCPHCKTFMPIWNKIINDLPTDATYEEINCDLPTSSVKVSENKITSVPSLVLLVDNQKKYYMGSRTYEDIARFLSINGVNLTQRSFEKFESTGTGTGSGSSTSSSIPNPTSGNPHCPAVSFDKEIDIANDNYMYQIFNANGQYGYATGGYNNNKLLTPFQAAYSTIDSYLSSLPDDSDSTKTSYTHVNECANLYASNIINFGLCDIDQLNAIQGYQSNVSSGISSAYIDGTDYSGNSQVVGAIMNACGFNS